LESALFINSFDSKDRNFKKATTSGCHHRGNEEKTEKKIKIKIQFYTYISMLVVMTKRKKKHLFLGTLIHTKKL